MFKRKDQLQKAVPPLHANSMELDFEEVGTGPGVLLRLLAKVGFLTCFLI